MSKPYMLIPGNPAVADYYYSWIKEIEEFNPQIRVTYATSYVLFGKRLSDIEYNLAMRNHYEKILLGLAKEEKVTILAHSAGSYFALRLLEKYPEKIDKVNILFPYIGYSTIESLKFLPFLYWIDRYLPLVEIVSLFKSFFSVYGEDIHNISYRQLVANLRFGIRQCVYFEKHKFNISDISTLADKVNFIYTMKDRWCPDETVSLLKTVSTNQLVEIPHDFVTSKVSRMKMIQELNSIKAL